jgi:ribonuclease-3
MVGSKLKGIFKTRSKPPRLKTDGGDLAAEMPKASIKKIEKILGYTFKNKNLLVKSLTHPSFLLRSSDQINNNQRLEFLGDAVIQLALTEALYGKYPNAREGELTKARSGYARGDYMAQIARRLELDRYLLLKERDRNAGIGKKDSALGDAFESVIGAVYLDSDWETARTLILRLYENLSESPVEKGVISNPKGVLQEMIQPKLGNNALRYETTAQEGDPHERVFEVTVFCNDEKLGIGKGRNKKEAAEAAATKAIAKYKKEK